MQQTHTHKAVTGRVEAKQLLSRQRQSEYSEDNICHVPEQTWYFWNYNCLITLAILTQSVDTKDYVTMTMSLISAV